MRRFIAFCLVVTTIVGLESRPAWASSSRDSRRTAALKDRLKEVLPGSEIAVKLNDRSILVGELSGVSEEGIELNAPEPRSIDFAAIRSVAENPAPQNNPGGQQTSGTPRNHHVRTVIIVLAVCFTFAIIAAIASKK